MNANTQQQLARVGLTMVSVTAISFVTSALLEQRVKALSPPGTIVPPARPFDDGTIVALSVVQLGAVLVGTIVIGVSLVKIATG